jgi:O-antigen ligase
MPPVLALVLTVVFIFFLFWRDTHQKPRMSRALWLPFIWYFLTASRLISQWMSVIGLPVGATSVEDGSPIDADADLALILSGLYVLLKRRVQLSEFQRQNGWLMLFLVFCLISVVWSDFPFIAFKRWIKILGHPIMALIILTEPDPLEAVRRVVIRTGYLYIPLSLLLAKYFPQFGRSYDIWTGQEYWQGASMGKNQLGVACMIIGIVFFWNLLQALQMKDRRRKLYSMLPKERGIGEAHNGYLKLYLDLGIVGAAIFEVLLFYEILTSACFLVMTGCLLKKSDSATSLATAVLGVIVVLVLGFPFVSKKRIGTYLIAGMIAFAAADSLFGIYGTIVHSLGRNLTLTDRTNIWATVLKIDPNPVLGVGFESFWLGDRLDRVYSMLPKERGIGEAHNGYLELYLDLGIVGVAIFGVLLFKTFRAINRSMLGRFQFARLRLALFISILVYNFTEAAFVGDHFIYAIFFLIAVEYNRAPRAPARRLRKYAPKELGGPVFSTAG